MEGMWHKAPNTCCKHGKRTVSVAHFPDLESFSWVMHGNCRLMQMTLLPKWIIITNRSNDRGGGALAQPKFPHKSPTGAESGLRSDSGKSLLRSPSPVGQFFNPTKLMDIMGSIKVFNKMCQLCSEHYSFIQGSSYLLGQRFRVRYVLKFALWRGEGKQGGNANFKT